MNVRVITRGTLHLIQNRCPLGVITCSAASQNQLQGQELPNKAISRNHAERIFESVKSRNLNDERPLWIKPIHRPNVFDLDFTEIDVLFTLRVNAWRDDVLWM